MDLAIAGPVLNIGALAEPGYRVLRLDLVYFPYPGGRTVEKVVLKGCEEVSATRRAMSNPLGNIAAAATWHYGLDLAQCPHLATHAPTSPFPATALATLVFAWQFQTGERQNAVLKPASSPQDEFEIRYYNPIMRPKRYPLR